MQTQTWQATKRKLNLGCGLQTLAGYVNVDKRDAAGVDLVTDLFCFPWPFEDEAYDEVRISHLIEHIPHLVRVWNASLFPSSYEPVWEEDGFFIFMREIHRILKPGGTVEIIGPYGRSTGADQDPTHTRSINEGTFRYLDGHDDPNFGYELGYRFTLEEFALQFNEPLPKQRLIDDDLQHLWNVAHSFRAILRKV